MIDNQRPTELSLFTGSGIGMLAAHHAGFRTVAWCENEPHCNYTLRRLWPDAKPYNDINYVTAESLLRSCGPVDLVSGGWPCQDISTAGRGEGLDGARSGLFFQVVRVLSELRDAGAPVPYVFLENVPAISVRGIERVVSELESLDYEVWCSVVGAWAVGAPHRRNRLWLVARSRHAKCSGRSSGKIGQQSATGRHGPTRRLITSLGGLAGITPDSVLTSGWVADAGSIGRRRRITSHAERCEPNGPAGGRQQDGGDSAGDSADGIVAVNWRNYDGRAEAVGNAASDGQRGPGVSAGEPPQSPGGSGGDGRPPRRRAKAYRPPVCPECCHAAIDADIAVAGPLCDGCAFFLAHSPQQRQREQNDAARTEPRSESRTSPGGGGPQVGDAAGSGQPQHRDERSIDERHGGTIRPIFAPAGPPASGLVWAGGNARADVERAVRDAHDHIGWGELGDADAAGLPQRTGQPSDDGTEPAATERASGRRRIQSIVADTELPGPARFLDLSRAAQAEPGYPDALRRSWAAGILRWPAGPGQPQHDWEWPRIAEFGLGCPIAGMAASVHERLDGSRGGASDQEVKKTARTVNKVMLRMLGNGWCYPNVYIVYRWIREMIEKEVEGHARQEG